MSATLISSAAGEQELLGWLRQILVNNIATVVEKHVLAARRDIRRETQIAQIGQSLEESAVRLEALLPARIDSPSMQVGAQRRGGDSFGQARVAVGRSSRSAGAAKFAGDGFREDRGSYGAVGTGDTNVVVAGA